MSDPSEKLSQRLREQVAALHTPADSQGPWLGRDAQRRVVHSLAGEAAKLERQRRQRVWLGSTAGAFLAAAAAVVFYLRGAEQPPTAAPHAQTAQAPQAETEACKLPLLAADGFAGAAGTRLLLGALGELVTQPQTELSVESSSACELALRLRSGTLAGDLHSLRPARLLIRTDHGEVVVTGTRFSVRSDADLEVLLETGVVDVQLQGAGKLRLQPRTRLRKAAAKPTVEREGLSNSDVQRLAGWLQPPPVAAAPESPVEPAHKVAVPAPFESSDAALAAAEAARRAQRWAAAREAYRFASQGRDSAAEVALLRWARFELEQTAPASALRLVADHKRKFSRAGVLQADAGFIEVQARKALGQSRRAEQAARALIERHPDTPQAAAARKLLEQPAE